MVVLPYCLKCGREIAAIGTTGTGICPTCGFVNVALAPIQGKPSQAKYCQYCGKELPADATFCPSCGRPSKPEVRTLAPSIPPKPKSKIGRNIVIAIVLIFIIVVGLGYGVYQASKPTPSTPILTPTQTPSPTPTLTPIKEQYDVVIRYTERYADSIGEYIEPSKGYTFLIVTLDIENKIDREFNTNPYFFNAIINNVEYDPHWSTYSLNDPLKAVDLHKGGKISGSMVFEVPKGTTAYTLVYEGLFYNWKIDWIHY